MGKTAQKDKKFKKTGVYGPDGILYTTGPGGEVYLGKCYNARGKCIGMHWCHKTKDLRWRKIKGDEVEI
jgi:hypothetical protein